MQGFKLCLVLFLILVGCAGNETKNNRPAHGEVHETPFEAKPVKVAKINPQGIGNVRLAFIKAGKKDALVLVNHDNTTHLKVREKTSKKRNEIAVEKLLYQPVFLTMPNVVILENNLMADLISFFRQYHFFKMAKKVTMEELKNKKWPEKDTIYLEQNNNLYCFYRPTINEEGGRDYITLKTNVLLAQRHGYRPMQIHTRSRLRGNR